MFVNCQCSDKARDGLNQSYDFFQCPLRIALNAQPIPKLTAMRKQIFIIVPTILILALVSYALTARLLDFQHFRDEINNQPLPKTWTLWIVYSTILLEIGIITALLFERSRLAGFYISLVLMTIYTLYSVAILLHFFPYVPCSCGGFIEKLTWLQNLTLNLVLLCLSLLSIIVHRRLDKKYPR
jgi:putative oxidoreductase